MSDYTLEVFTADGKYIIKNAEGEILTNEPLAKIDALAKLEELQAPAPILKKKKNKPKKVKKEKGEENDKREEDGRLDD